MATREPVSEDLSCERLKKSTLFVLVTRKGRHEERVLPESVMPVHYL